LAGLIVEITQQADYAVRTVLDLALRSTEERVSSEAIAQRQSIPPAFLAKIVARLAAAGIVQTQRGVNGGICLARSASDITLLHVIEAIDGPITLNRCVRHPSDCPRDNTCVVHPIWSTILTELRARLNGFNFATIAANAQSASSPGQPIRLLEELPMKRS
jgi:Rrf2 family iron-sulfur cluster assembly transcriptional regulator